MYLTRMFNDATKRRTAQHRIVADVGPMNAELELSFCFLDCVQNGKRQVHTVRDHDRLHRRFPGCSNDLGEVSSDGRLSAGELQGFDLKSFKRRHDPPKFLEG